MTAEQIRKRIAAIPFCPFDVCLADGRAIRVDHVELLAFDGGNRIVVICGSAGIVEVIDLMLVLSLRFHEPDFVHASPEDEVVSDDKGQ